MCPSYMATRDEKHSTRGRANALRLVMAGKLHESGLGDEGVKDVMSPLPRVPRVQGRVPGRRRRRAVQERVPRRLLVAAWDAAPCACCLDTSASSRAGAAGSRRCRMSSRRAFRRAGSTSKSSGSIDDASRRRGHRRRSRSSLPRNGSGPSGAHGGCAAPAAAATQVAVFNDTFTNYYNPQIGVAGVNVLQRLGCDTTLAPNVCCGRPLISQGLLARGPRARGSEHREAVPSRRARTTDCVLRAELLVGDSRGRAGAARRRGATQGQTRRRRDRALRGIRAERIGRTTYGSTTVPRGFSCTATVTSGRWGWCHRRRRCSNALPAPP